MTRGIVTGAHGTVRCLTALLLLVNAREMVSNAARVNYNGEARSQAWRHSTHKHKARWQGSDAILVPSPWGLDQHRTSWLRKGAGKQQILYCRVGIGFHLQILPSGRVNGTHESSQYGIMEFFSIKAGIVCIRAVVSQLFLAITSQGKLYGSETFTEDCMFKEQMEEHYYNTYASHTHPRLYVALSKRGAARNGSKARRFHASTHFIPRPIRGS
ncbi:fibroblast growth factor 4A-like [Rhinoraja longicauda]